METTRFSNLLMGLRSSEKLDHEKSGKFYNAFAKGILEGDLDVEQIKQLYEAIPYKRSCLYELCENKQWLAKILHKTPLNDVICVNALNFIENCIDDVKEKACFASFFIKMQHLEVKEDKWKYAHVNKPYYGKFWPFINGKTLISDTLSNISYDGNSSISLESMELLCKLADEADQDGLGVILKRIHADYLDWPVDPLIGVEKSPKGRKLLKRLFLRLCEYQPITCPKGTKFEDWPKFNYDHEKRISEGAVYTVRKMIEEKSWREEDYSDLKEKVGEAYIQATGGILRVACNFYDKNWYISRITQEIKKLGVVENWYSAHNSELKGELRPEILEEFFTEFAKKDYKEPIKIVRFVIEEISKMKPQRCLSMFLKVVELYIGKADITWRTFADFLHSKELENIKGNSDAWSPIVNAFYAKEKYSGKDFEYAIQMHEFLSKSQRQGMQQRMRHLTLIDNFEAWNKLYDITKLYNVGTEGYPKEIIEQFELMRLADEF